MQNHVDLLPPPPLADLAARQTIALFLDFDGTLVDLAPAPDQIRVPPDLTQNLQRLQQNLDGRLAIITGRSLADLDGFLGPNDIPAVGSHGAEYRGAPPSKPPMSRASLQSVAKLHKMIPKLFVEHKPYGLAVHYRQEPATASRVYKVMEKIAAFEKLAIKPGKMLVEIGPSTANKGTAVTNLMRTDPFVGSMPIFIGDDLTDEDGFQAVCALQGLAILVGGQRTSAASFRLGGPSDVRTWLSV